LFGSLEKGGQVKVGVKDDKLAFEFSPADSATTTTVATEPESVG
jgi:hypothetical protein